MERYAFWNNGLTKSTNLGVTFARSDTTVNDFGQSVSAGTARYSAPKLLCPAPKMMERRADVQNIQVWSGRWTDGSACLVELWTSSTGTVSTSVAFDDYPADTSRVKSLGTTNNLAVQSGWRDTVRTFVICDGLVLAFCEGFDTSGGSPVPKNVSLCYWDETVGGTKEWRKHYRGPDVQPNHPRGAGWMATGPWIPPDGMDESSGRIKKFFVAWADYRHNGAPGGANATGGQLFIMLCTWNNSTSRWELGDAVLLYEELITTSNGAILPSYLTDGFAYTMHFHSAAITFRQTGEDPDVYGMTVTLCIGDTFPNNRLVNIDRDDYNDYATGAGSTATASNPTPPDKFPPDVPFPTPPPNANDWTTYEDREGQRARVYFEDAIYHTGTPATITASGSALANLASPASGEYLAAVVRKMQTGTGTPRTGYWARGVNSVTSGNALSLVNDLSGYALDGDKVSGYIFSDNGLQGVGQLPLPGDDEAADRERVLMTGDEQGTTIYKYTVDEPGDRIVPRIVHGVMTDTSAAYSSPPNVNLGWNPFLVAMQMPFQEGDYTVSDYLVLVVPNSRAPWVGETQAEVMEYSSDGEHWGNVFAPNLPQLAQFAFFIAPEAEGRTPEIYLGRQDGAHLYSIPKPTSETTRLWRPLSISGGATNLLLTYTEPGSGKPSIERSAAPIAPNTTVPVTVGPSGDFDIPKPPCAGPIMHCTFAAEVSAGTWKLTDPLPFEFVAPIRARLWVYKLPSTGSAGPNTMPVSGPAAITVRSAHGGARRRPQLAHCLLARREQHPLSPCGLLAREPCQQRAGLGEDHRPPRHHLDDPGSGR